MSRIGIGTARGSQDEATDLQMLEVLTTALAQGVRIIDTAVNYRAGRSERVVGAALRLATEAGVPRHAVTVSSKAGFVRPPGPFPAPGPPPERHDPTDHCLAPACLSYHLACSLMTTGLERIDVYYLHNPERALMTGGDREFRELMTGAFSVLEEAVAAGLIGQYGVATWTGASEPGLSMTTMVAAARAAAGGDAHLRYLQGPLSMHDRRALDRRPGGERSLVAECQDLGVDFVASAAGGGGRAPSLTSASVHWTATRPGVSAALVGTVKKAHLIEVLDFAGDEDRQGQQ